MMLNKGKRPGFIDVFCVDKVKFGLLPPLLFNVKWSPLSRSNSEDNININSKDIDFDVECIGDLSFKSGIKFHVSTKLTANWPMNGYTIPVSLEIEIVEIIGRVKFGVKKGCSYLSFIEEPTTRFSIHSQIGESYKLKDFPKISEFVIKKMKSFIRNKFVSPNSHKFRLIWPRNWWPEGIF
jgi:hypothetical protein